jgi:hypothetical protein
VKIKVIRLLLLSTAAVLLVACGGAAEPEVDIETAVEATVKAVLTAVPTATLVPTPTPQVIIKEVIVEKVVTMTVTATPAPVPTATPIPTVAPTPTASPAKIVEAIPTATILPTLEPTDVSKNHKSVPAEYRTFHGCSGTGSVKFDQSPMRYEDFSSIKPYGNVSGAHVTPTDHMYFQPMDRSLGPDSYEVRAIGDGVIYNLSPRDVHVDIRKKGRDWRMDIAHTCSFHSYFDLLTSIAPDILSEWEKTQGKTNSGWVGIPIKSGQVVGRIGGQTLDFAVYDYEVVVDGFIFPEHYNREVWKIHTVDPFPYFPADVREVLLQKNLRKVEPFAGRIDFDIDGKFSGNWFEVGTNWYSGKNKKKYWDGHLAIVPNLIDPASWMFSIGHWSGKSTDGSGAANFIIVSLEPNPKNAGIHEGIVKYELAEYWYCLVDEPDNCSKNWTPEKQLLARPIPNPSEDIGVALIQMIEDQLLKVEVFPGKKASQVEDFTSAAKLYER